MQADGREAKRQQSEYSKQADADLRCLKRLIDELASPANVHHRQPGSRARISPWTAARVADGSRSEGIAGFRAICANSRVFPAPRDSSGNHKQHNPNGEKY